MLAISGQRMAALEGYTSEIGIDVKFVQGDNPEGFDGLIDAICLESWVFEINLVNIPDFEAICRYFIKPIEHGADIGGWRSWNNNRGTVIDGSKSPWNNRGFPIFTNPSSDHHGLIYWDIFGYNAFTMKARSEIMRNSLANVRDAKTLVIHPVSTTHQQLTGEQQLSAGVNKEMIRVSVGYEHIDDIKEDFTIAFENIKNQLLVNILNFCSRNFILTFREFESKI
ncbi:unnamed protein product [Rhizophagus irregularis]|nr:unnamed protein product [Rhizophagus irregularis]